MVRILYISFNSITEPLVQSQVVSYLKGLQKLNFSFILMTAEIKFQESKVAEIQNYMKNMDIIWLPIFKNRFSTLGQIYKMVNAAKSLIIQRKVKLIHARSYFSGIVAYLAHKKTNCPFIYDIRGFWIDEKVYKGKLKQNSIAYKILKIIDNSIYKNSDGIVTLTKKSAKIIQGFSMWNKRLIPQISVIPTCVDNNKFRDKQNSSPSIVYLGSIGDGYMGGIIFKVFYLIQKYFPHIEIILISRSDERLIKKLAIENKVDINQINHMKLNHNQVSTELGKYKIGLSFIKPHFSKQASCATKIGEYLSCGIPVMSNSGIGDMDTVLNKDISVICNDFSEESLLKALKAIITLSLKKGTSYECVNIAKDYFSLQKGIEKYSSLYESILKEY